ncbi:MAG: ATP-dependent helicase [Anaerophaga sp.]|uniref:ATP-dependent helicase n=1 Tax=Anaerophaga thermohalophila TaxID=177400 RepID=UPI000237CF83|nr:UvrD-helicase domain-containing protein [Anaerophaga thermohalophila]MBZ4675856.1 ATP-dependent helicase [Anaerophaga sp.]MDI3520538.1 ATP-dependent helicase UvrD/PcrA [Anaerophaga sp.]
MENYLEQLNEAQYKAVVDIDGPALVIAGAGSGKTRVLTYRIAYLLNNGVPPWTILALTFTNKAAGEMKERIGQIVGHEMASKLWMGTFHSIFARILRMEAKHINFPPTFTIYDTTDSKSLINSILRNMKLNKNKAYKPGTILGRISSAKNDLIVPAAYAQDQKRTMADAAANIPMMPEIYEHYVRECRKAGAMDFDDLLLNTNILFRDHPEVLAKYQERFKYILVDEYQDTNFSQYLITRKLAEKHKNICVVGDDAQSIYSFRGAKIENILNFRNDYPDYKLFKLEQNYRSTQTIVNAANSIIVKNRGQIHKKIYSRNDEGARINLIQAHSDVDEGFIVVNDINEVRLRHQYQYQDFAILYRTNAQSRIFEEALRKKNIPYKIYGGLSFYQRKEIKDLLAYLRVSVNPNDNEALKRIINYPARGIGKTTMDKIEALANHNNVSLWAVLTNPALPNTGFNAGTLRKLNSFTRLISGFISQVPNLSAFDITNEIATQSGILKELHQDKTHESQTRLENLEELFNAIREFSDNRQESGENNGLADFLQEVSLLTDQDTEKPDDINKVTLMTIHAAKGLEFKNVYIVGIEEGLFPSGMASTSEAGLEEERRLFYVALTRAQERATLTFSRSRYKFGELTFARPSRFLGEIDQSYLNVPGEANSFAPPKTPLSGKKMPEKRTFSFEKTPPGPKQKVNFSGKVLNRQSATKKFDDYVPASGKEIQPGIIVEHERFGRGKVLHIEGEHPNVKATVFFNNAGQKQLLLKFAKLKIIS